MADIESCSYCGNTFRYSSSVIGTPYGWKADYCKWSCLEKDAARQEGGKDPRFADWLSRQKPDAGTMLAAAPKPVKRLRERQIKRRSDND